MTRTVSSVIFFLFLSVAAAADDNEDRYPHIRSTSGELIAAVQEGIAQSPLFRELVEALDASNVVVYLAEGPQRHGEAAHLSFIGEGGGRRYLRVQIDSRYSGSARIALLGHELQHAVEIALEPSVNSAASLARLYSRIGFLSCHDGHESFDTRAAIDAGRQVHQELFAAGGR